MLPTVATKAAVVAPDDTETDAGTLTAPLLAESDTVAPPPETGCVIVTVQVAVLPEFTVVGVQDTLLRAIARLTEMLNGVSAPTTLLASLGATEKL